MFKLTSTLIKEFRLLIRDKVGLAVMFLMPIVLVIVMTSIQNSTFELINTNKIPLLVSNNDTSVISNNFVSSLGKTGMFTIIAINRDASKPNLLKLMHKHDALVVLSIPSDFSNTLKCNAQNKANRVLQSFGLSSDSMSMVAQSDSLQIYFQPILEETYRYSIKGSLQGMLQIMENKLMMQSLYFSINNTEMPHGFENEMRQNQVALKEVVLTNFSNSKIPNASEHNVPAWTLFAMFFTIVSLGGNMVKEKNSGNFVRLRLMPTNYMVGLIAKQLIYLCVVLLQVAVIFSIGKWVFPFIHLPVLQLPSNLMALLIVSIVCGWSAISFALCIGVFAQTQEQASGFGSVSIVILAAFGGVFVPVFAMPDAFGLIMKMSPFYWGLEAYYGLFLADRQTIDVYLSLIPLISFSVFLQLTAFYGLKLKSLI